MKPLCTDEQLEEAYLAHITVYARCKTECHLPLIGAIEAFTPLFVRIGGQMLVRDEYELRVCQVRTP